MRLKELRYQSWIICLLLMVQQVECQHHMERRQKIDVQHYDFAINLSDTSDIIFCNAGIDLIFKEPVEFFTLDLVCKGEQGKGMTVKSVTVDGKESRFRHQNDSLFIFRGCAKPNTSATVMVKYSGMPADGLIISKNMFGDRTFFGDNWPDRAHNWLACIDHPSDKATVDFKISACPFASNPFKTM